MSVPIYLVELEGLPPGAGATTVLRFCTGEGYVTGPAEAPANASYQPRVSNPGTFERHLWAPGTTRGAGSITLGLVELVNADGALDSLLDWSFDGRRCTILAGNPAAGRAAFAAVWSGHVQQLSLTGQTATVRLRDRAAVVGSALLSSSRYGGTNSGPTGLDGLPTDLQGKCKPVLFGTAENFQPPCVNTSTLIYQLSAAPIAQVMQVWAAGAAISPGVQRASAAALAATAPAGGTYDWSLGSGAEGAYVRLGSNPGQSIVTAMAAEGASGMGTRNAAQVAQRILASAGVAGADVLGAAALATKNPAVVGLWAGTEDTTVADALDAVCASVGASWTPNRAGQFQLLRLEAPDGTAPAITYGEWQILDADGAGGITILPTADSDRGIPAYQVALTYARNFTPMSGANVAGAVDAADPTRRAWLGLADRSVSATDPSIWNPVAGTGSNPLSQPVSVATLLRSLADAQAEATRLLGVYGRRPDGTQRRYLSFAVQRSQVGGVDLGQVIALSTRRFGLAGRPLLVTGLLEDLRQRRTTIFAWG